MRVLLSLRLASIVGRMAGAALLACGLAGTAAAELQGEPLWIGVSGPLTGPSAQYGAQWKKGFDLALDQINADGGVRGRPLRYVFEDSQNDPKQTVAIAQKFVTDPRILIELGDFSSPASMAASPIYQRAGLVQFGFTNSHPDFTKGGDFIWSNSISQAEEQPNVADYAVNSLKLKRLAVLHLNTDWGRTSKDIFVKAAKERGAEVVAAEAYLPEEKDFRSSLVRVREANPDGIVLISYYADGAAIARQLKPVGLSQPVVAVGSVYSPKFLELGGEAVNGIHTRANFFPAEPRPEVRSFVAAYRAKYNEEPDAFGAYAYDAVLVARAVIQEGGPDRSAVRDAFYKVKNIPSVIFGSSTFDPETRRVSGVRNVKLVVKDGAFALWDGTVPAAPGQ
ncbi:amino acid/amide ABC transporter substrate-binding protein (HAAT family) [Azospirillum baldaniorum]|uniref:ABC transporter substrate-binding protein n=1 Tax=Azospirillum baldaniorum TaxID=1064539 RepID=UPI0011A6CC99|nr:ABC transporter substrate-binding protein [Azospirillum baldaniorum]TWA57343.1 amino acid/amide ABC transporter substrate-binding protein (HAAT family) [Azospirillum baldaniorum]